MKIKEIPSIDYRVEGNQLLVQKKILELPMFKKYNKIEDLTFERLEAAVLKLQKKFPIYLGYIMTNAKNDPPCYSLMIKHATEHAHITTVYATSMREGYEKVLLFGYHYCMKYFKED